MNPYDVTATARALHEALTMPEAERAERTKRLAAAATALPPQRWFLDQLEALRACGAERAGAGRALVRAMLGDPGSRRCTLVLCLLVSWLVEGMSHGNRTRRLPRRRGPERALKYAIQHKGVRRLCCPTGRSW